MIRNDTTAFKCFKQNKYSKAMFFINQHRTKFRDITEIAFMIQRF